MIRVLIGDALEQLRTLPDESVHCVVTSPPYWGLRDYSRCSCSEGILNPMRTNCGELTGLGAKPADPSCPICHGTGLIEGVKEHQLGLEKTPEEYVQKMVEIFREVKRVLRIDGSLWLNMGDSYATHSAKGPNAGQFGNDIIPGFDGVFRKDIKRGAREISGLKEKDLVGMPWRLAFALQADGWWLRCDNIWAKKNCMPESTKDRPTKAHEYIFLLTKSGTTKYWTHPEQAGMRTRPTPDVRWIDRLTETSYKEKPADWTPEMVPCPDCEGGKLDGWFGQETCETCKGRGKVRRWYRKNLWEGHDYFYDQEAVRESAAWSSVPTKRYESHAVNGSERPGGNRKLDAPNPSGRNLRSIWEINTQPYSEAHFATFPEELPRRCIKAGTSEKGCCAKCGAPWERIVGEAEYKKVPSKCGVSGNVSPITQGKHLGQDTFGSATYGSGFVPGFTRFNKTLGWRPTCQCNADVVPCVVLDPFAGSGTTGFVARSLGRKAILIELNPQYGKLIEKRAMSNIPDICEAFT